jgi:hypothetical protein
MLHWGGSEQFEWRCRYLPGNAGGGGTKKGRCGNLSACSDLNPMPSEYEGQVSAVRPQRLL